MFDGIDLCQTTLTKSFVVLTDCKRGKVSLLISYISMNQQFKLFTKLVQCSFRGKQKFEEGFCSSARCTATVHSAAVSNAGVVSKSISNIDGVMLEACVILMCE